MEQDIIQGGELVSPPSLEIRINKDFTPTFDDMVTLEDMSSQEEVKGPDGQPLLVDGKPLTRSLAKWRDVRALFNRAIVGGAGHLPTDAATMGAIGAALKAHFEARANPKT